MNNKNIVVIGDTILDEYIYVEPNKISDEAHVITSNIYDNKYSLGGASNVARNIASLNKKCIYIGTSSPSIDKIIKSELQKYGISKYLLLSKKDAIQTKTRIISSRGSQVFRYDSKFVKYDYSDSIPKIMEFLEKLKNQIDFIVISKYYDNFFSPKLIKELLKFCKQNKIKSIVDNRQNNINDFVGVDFYKMNFNEFKNAFNCLECRNELNDIKKIVDRSSINFKNILLTRSEKSTILISKNNNNITYLEIPVHSAKVRDVSGAGDTFVASFSSFHYQYQDDMLKLINFVHQICKIVVSKIGTEVVWKDEINSELNLDDLKFLVKRLKKENKKIIFTNGVFDILHSGHIKLLKEAKENSGGDYLIVGINSDKSVKQLKGESRPYKSQEERKIILQSLKYVDSVIVFNELNVKKLLKIIKPNYYVKGGDYTLKTLPERDCLQYIDNVIFVDILKGKSSTNIINKMKDSK